MKLNLRQVAAAGLLLSPLFMGAQELPSAPSAVAAEQAAINTEPVVQLTFATPNTVTSASSNRLSTEEKFSSFVAQTNSPYTTFSSAIAASFRPAWNNSPYAESYASRFGQSAMDSTEQGFFTKFLLPSAFHQDPRYFRSDSTETSDRLTYALSRVFVTRSDNGHSTLNTSEILGSVIAASLSTAYHPYRRHTPGEIASSAAGSIGSDAGINMLREFWPDIREHLMDHGPKMVQSLVVRLAPRTIPGTMPATNPANN